MKKSIRKILTGILALALLCGLLAGCQSAPTEAKKVGVIQLVQHTSLDTIREAMLEEFKALGYTDETLVVDVQDGQGDMSNIASIAQKFVGDKVDVIVAIATPAAQIAINEAQDSGIPVVFSACTNPADLGIANFDAPEGISTGTSDLIPVDSALDLAREIDPELSTIGLLYNAGEANSVSVMADARAYCEANGIAYQEGTIAALGDLQQVASALATQVDAIFTPIDNSIASAMPVLSQVGIDTKTPIYCGADSMVQDGGLGAVGIRYEGLGQETARMVKQLLDGKSVSQVPVKFFDDFSVFINQRVAGELGLDIPQSVLDRATIFE